VAALVDAFWRAAAYCVHPRVIVLSLAPLLVAVLAVAGLGWFYWEPALDTVRAALEGWEIAAAVLDWVQHVLGADVRSVLVPLIVVALALPLVLLLCLLLVATVMTPALVNIVSARRFPALERRHGATWWQALGASLGGTMMAGLALVVSLPLWLLPPLALVIPPLIWGWLSARVFAFDVLAEHADRQERRALVRRHRWPLLAIGLASSVLGALPGFVWTLAMPFALPLAPLLAPAVVWLYVLVFAFTALWFAHYALAALEAQRAAAPAGENHA